MYCNAMSAGRRADYLSVEICAERNAWSVYMSTVHPSHNMSQLGCGVQLFNMEFVWLSIPSYALVSLPQ